MSNTTLLWITLIAAGLITYAFRLSFILLLGRIQLSPLVQRALRFVPPAALTAIIFPELLIRDGELAIGPNNPRLLAGLFAIIVAWRTKSILWTIVVGMVTLWLFQWLM